MILRPCWSSSGATGLPRPRRCSTHWDSTCPTGRWPSRPARRRCGTAAGLPTEAHRHDDAGARSGTADGGHRRARLARVQGDVWCAAQVLGELDLDFDHVGAQRFSSSHLCCSPAVWFLRWFYRVTRCSTIIAASPCRPAVGRVPARGEVTRTLARRQGAAGAPRAEHPPQAAAGRGRAGEGRPAQDPRRWCAQNCAKSGLS